MPIASHEYEFVCELIHERAGILLDAGKEYLVESRLAPLARDAGLGSAADFIARMQSGPEAPSLQRRAVEALTTNETSFFRDIHPFTAMRNHVLPGLIERRSKTRKLRIWCAAASSGQEPYSVAMLLLEHFPSLFADGWKVEFMASDYSSEMIQRCRQGRFSQLEVNRGLPAPLLVKYFTKQGTEWQVSDLVRNMVEFREMNLCQEWPGMADVDILFMRNVLIYFSVPTKRGIFARVRRVLSSDGFMFLGGAETTYNLDEAFERVQVQGGGVYRLRQAA